MGFSSSTVSIGNNTKKSDYDRLLDNTQYNKEQNNLVTYVDQSSTVSTIYIKTKIIEIGDWNMDVDQSKLVNHGLDITKIRTIHCIIRNDSNNTYWDFAGSRDPASETASQHLTVTNTQISLKCATGGVFDDVSFDSTSYNRGWITILYEE